VNCDGIEDAGFELCSATTDTCTAVFTNGAGCTTVCAAAGLTCASANEDVQGECAADTSRPAVACDSGHSSDYCVCRRTGGGGSGSGGSSGATGGTAGSSTGGTSTGGTSTGGTSTGGTSTGGTAGTPSIGPGPCGCATPAGEFGTVTSTITVDSGEVYDGQCRIYRADPDRLGDGSQAEGQQPVFEVESGGTLKNVVIGASGADGIHVSGTVTLENVHWLDIGEDALTVDGSSGTVTINCGSAANSADKVFQVNTASTLRISNFTVRSAGKFIRQNGGTSFRVDAFIDHSDISDMGEAVFRTDSTTSHVTLTNSRYSDIGEGLFIFGSTTVNGNSDQSTVSNIAEY
jgi:pectate lyase C